MHCDYTHDTPVSHGPKQRPPTASRLQKESKILSVAEDQFAHWGFEGASLENIAIGVGMSRHNLLYYYPNKEMLYHRLLDAVLEEWLVHLDQLAKGEDPEQALRQYIKAKLEYSRKRPNGVRLFAQEMLAGAPHFGKTVKERVTPLLNQALARFEQWADEGKIASLRINVTNKVGDIDRRRSGQGQNFVIQYIGGIYVHRIISIKGIHCHRRCA